MMNPEDLDGYINKYVEGMTILEVDRIKRKTREHFPYNSYLNEALEYIETKLEIKRVGSSF